MLTRADIAAAASTVPGVTGMVDRPAALEPGTSWPVLRSERPVMGGCAVEVRWYVMVVGPSGDEGTTTRAADPLVEPLVAAMRGAGLVVEEVEPVRLPIEPGQAGVPALRFGVVDNAWIGYPG